jgi:uncharacterized protein (TIGR02284 family)
MSNSFHEALAALHTAIVDAREGYLKAIEKADDQTVAATFRETRALHDAAHDDIHAALSAKGATPGDDGSFMGTVHKTVISVRSAVAGLDEGSLASFASGEENILEKYDDAIRDERDEGVAAMLRAHRQRLAGRIAEMKRLAA